MRLKIEFTADADELIKNLVENKKSIDFIKEEINNKLNISYSRSVLSRHIYSLGLDISNNKIRKSIIDENELIMYIIDGLDYDEISKKFNTNIKSLSKYIVKHNIANKMEKKKRDLQTWFGNGIVDLRKIKDESINDIEKKLKYPLTKNAVVEIEGKKFLFDFYSEKHDIAFLCCLYNPEKNPGLHMTEMPNRKHAIVDKVQWDWINKIREMNPLITIIPYFYWDSNVTADHINEIMKDPSFIDGEAEKRKSSTMYFHSVICQDK